MKVFLSWSGERSRKVAELLHENLQSFINEVQPWVSTQDLEAGTFWGQELNEQLANQAFGIACVTNENKHSTWLHYECGALAKGLTKGRVYVLCIDLKPAELSPPLGLLNATPFSEEGMRKLLTDMNKNLPQPLATAVILRTFQYVWPSLQDDITTIFRETQEQSLSSARTADEMLLEVVTSMRKLESRFDSFAAFPDDVIPVQKESIADERYFRAVVVWEDKRNQDAKTILELQALVETSLEQNVELSEQNLQYRFSFPAPVSMNRWPQLIALLHAHGWTGRFRL